MVYEYAMEDHVVEIHQDDTTGNFGMRSNVMPNETDRNAHNDEDSETTSQYTTAFPLSKICCEIRAEVDMEVYYAKTKFVVGDFKSILSLPRPPLSLPPSSNRSLANPVYRAAVTEIELSKKAYNSYYNSYEARQMPTSDSLPPFPSLRWNGFVGLERIYAKVGPARNQLARGTWSRSAWIGLTMWSNAEKTAVANREGHHSELVILWR